MSKVKFISSYEHSECGLACIAMMINYFVKKISLTTLREEYGVPLGGFNIEQMLKIMNNYNIPGKAMKVHNIYDLVEIKEPFIAYYNLNHFVIVEKFKNNKVNIIDPAKGRLKVTVKEFEKEFSGVIICSLIEKNNYRVKFKINKDLLEIIKKNNKFLIFTLVLTFLLQLLTLYIPMYIKYIIDSYNCINDYRKLFSVLFFIVIFYFSFSVVKVRIIAIFHNNFDKMLISKTVKHLLKLPIKFFINRGKGEIIFTINSNQYIRTILSTQIISLFIDIVFLVLYFILMLSYSIKLSIVTIVLGILLVSISIINTKILIKKNQTQLTNITDVQNITNEIVNNISTIKSVGAEKAVFNKWNIGFEKQLKLEIEKSKIDSVLGNIPATIQITYSLIVFVVGIFLGNSEELTIGTIVAFNVLGASFLSPMLSIANSYLQLSAAKIYINQLLDIMNSRTEFNEEHTNDFKLENGNITLKSVYFKYDYFSKYVIDDFNINIKSGEKVALVGASGSGKSTLLMLMAGLYEPSKGIVSVGNNTINANDINKRYYREQLGIVLQESMLFNGSIKDNILLGRCSSEEEIAQAVKISNLDSFIQNFSSGLDTIISEEGNNISGGQRQKLCIARAVLKKPKLLLMDEPTSSLDNISESIIMEKLFLLEATLLVVAHRLSNISKFDKIIVLNNGKIVACGCHSELLKNCKYYKELYDKRD